MADPKRAGFQLIDLTIATTIMVIILGAFAKTVFSVGSLTDTVSLQSELVQSGNLAFNQIVEELKFSGYTTKDGWDYPYVFDNGNPIAAFETHEHDAPMVVSTKEIGQAQPVSVGAGVVISRDIVFLTPEDGDGDDVPDIDALGGPVWSSSEVSFVLIPDGDSNRLERRVDGVLDRTLARNVESVLFDTPDTSVDVPLNCVRVCILFSKAASNGHRISHKVMSTVRLRNGGLGL